MAEQVIPGINGAEIMSGLDATVSVVFWIVIIAGLLLVIGIIIWYFSFKYRVIIREVVNDRIIIKNDRAKTVKDKGGIHYWKLRGYNVRIPVPPGQAIDVDHKGRKCAEFYKLTDGTFIPINDPFNQEDFKKDHPEFKPFPTEQRALLIHELEEAEKYRKKKISEILIGLAPYLAIALILIIFMIFFNDVVEPTVQLGNSLVTASEKVDNSLNLIAGMLGNATSVKVEYRPTPPGG